MDPSAELHALTDRLLLERGEFDAIEFLLQRGWLDRADQLAWRRGDLTSLQAALGAPLAEVIATLEAAIRYAKSQGLRRVARPAPRALNTDTMLVYGGDPHFALLCAGLLQPPADRGQGDLFQDSADVFELEALRVALAEHRLDAAAEALQRLRRHNQRDAEAYARLIAAVDCTLPAPACIDRIERELAPTARRLLKARARDYLSPLWATVAGQLAGHAFDPTRPELHASHAWMQAAHWRQAAASIVDEVPDWAEQPQLLVRLASIQARQHRLAESRGWRMQLCWHFPEPARVMLDGLGADDPDRALGRYWREFGDAECELPVPLFPAWLLLADPQQRRWLSPDRVPDRAPADAQSNDAVAAYRQLHQLLAQPDDLDARRALQRLQPDLLRMFLALRERQRL